jgi:hypothetical protein
LAFFLSFSGTESITTISGTFVDGCLMASSKVAEVVPFSTELLGLGLGRLLCDLPRCSAGVSEGVSAVGVSVGVSAGVSAGVDEEPAIVIAAEQNQKIERRKIWCKQLNSEVL